MLELSREFDAARRRRTEAINLQRMGAWWSMALQHGTAKMPTLDSILLPVGDATAAPAREMTPDQLRGMVETMQKLYGGRIIRGDWTKGKDARRKRHAETSE